MEEAPRLRVGVSLSSPDFTKRIPSSSMGIWRLLFGDLADAVADRRQGLDTQSLFDLTGRTPVEIPVSGIAQSHGDLCEMPGLVTRLGSMARDEIRRGRDDLLPRRNHEWQAQSRQLSRSKNSQNQGPT